MDYKEELKKLNNFTPGNVDLTRKYLQGVFEDLERHIHQETGLVIKLDGNLSYNRHTVNFKFSLFNPKASGGKSIEEQKWSDNCYKHGMSSTDFGKSFSVKGEDFKITGCRPRRGKRPIIAENSNGDSFVFPTHMVRDLK